MDVNNIINKNNEILENNNYAKNEFENYIRLEGKVASEPQQTTMLGGGYFINLTVSKKNNKNFTYNVFLASKIASALNDLPKQGDELVLDGKILGRNSHFIAANYINYANKSLQRNGFIRVSGKIVRITQSEDFYKLTIKQEIYKNNGEMKENQFYVFAECDKFECLKNAKKGDVIMLDGVPFTRSSISHNEEYSIPIKTTKCAILNNKNFETEFEPITSLKQSNNQIYNNRVSISGKLKGKIEKTNNFGGGFTGVLVLTHNNYKNEYPFFIPAKVAKLKQYLLKENEDVIITANIMNNLNHIIYVNEIGKLKNEHLVNKCCFHGVVKKVIPYDNYSAVVLSQYKTIADRKRLNEITVKSPKGINENLDNLKINDDVRVNGYLRVYKSKINEKEHWFEICPKTIEVVETKPILK